MTFEEYRAKQMAIKEQIANYHIENCDLSAQIAHNEREIIKLNWELTELHNNFMGDHQEDEL